MKVNFLGTGTSQGVPVILCNCEVCKSTDTRDKRLRSSILIEVDGLSLVIDTGPDFRQQILRSNVQKLDGVLFTHEHKDHVAGLDDIRAFNYIQKRPMDVYAEKRVQEALKREYAYVFAEFKYPGIPEMNMHLINEEPFEIGNTQINPIRVLHYRLPILGYRIKDFAYITDANFIEEKELAKLKGLKVLVINALRKSDHISHYTLSGALEVIEKVKPEKAFLTHISHLMGKHEGVEKELPENVRFSYDGLVLEIDCE